MCDTWLWYMIVWCDCVRTYVHTTSNQMLWYPMYVKEQNHNNYLSTKFTWNTGMCPKYNIIHLEYSHSKYCNLIGWLCGSRAMVDVALWEYLVQITTVMLNFNSRADCVMKSLCLVFTTTHPRLSWSHRSLDLLSNCYVVLMQTYLQYKSTTAECNYSGMVCLRLTTSASEE